MPWLECTVLCGSLWQQRHAPNSRIPPGKSRDARSNGRCQRPAPSGKRQAASGKRLARTALARPVRWAQPLGRPARLFPHVCRPLVSSNFSLAAPAPKVRSSKTSRQRCNPRKLIMNDIKQISCNCATCSGTGCLCGCQQAAAQPAAQPIAQATCACGSQCKCGPSCTCAKP
jgi:hypothetical protein